MYRGKKILALVTARGGSKGLPGKNIRQLCGKPLIAWTIEAGRKSNYIDRIVVSTDDAVIARIARKFKAEVPFMRPMKLASDKAKSIDVVIHTLDFLKAQGQKYDCLILLEPTSPLRTAKDLDRAIEILMGNKRGAESIVGVSRVGATHPDFDVTVNTKGFLQPYKKNSKKAVRRQDLSELYFLEGSLYAAYVKSLYRRRTFYHSRTLPYVVPKWKSFEVDDIIDLICIEAVMKNYKAIKKQFKE